MTRLTVGTRMYLVTGFLCLVIGAVGTYGVYSIKTLQTITDSVVNDSVPGISNAGRIAVNQAENQIRVQRALRATTPEERQAIKAEIAAVASGNTASLKAYEKSIFSVADRRNFDAFNATRGDNTKLRTKFFELLETDRAAAERLLNDEVKAAYEAYSRAGDTLVNYKVKNADERAAALKSSVQSSIRVIAVVSLLCVLAGAGISVLFVRGITAALRQMAVELRRGADQVASTASLVASSAQSLARGSSEQAASLEETSASMEEMGSMTRQTDQNTRQAASLMNDTIALVTRANGALADMVESMSGIADSSRKVSKIIKTIDEIAFQTNILALNAAVEAARAGEAGLGFAVVADEVRNLAQRAGQAAKDTSSLIEESLGRSRAGEARVQQMAESIGAITGAAAQVRQLVSDVSVATNQQSTGIGQVAQTVSQMERVTQATAATAEEAAAASEELNAQAETSMEVVAGLAALIDGSGPPPAAEPAARAGKIVRLRPASNRPALARDTGPATGTFGRR
jgi:methyl-accepting chemotaxis protein